MGFSDYVIRQRSAEEVFTDHADRRGGDGKFIVPAT
jgi:hypothetical protein